MDPNSIDMILQLCNIDDDDDDGLDQNALIAVLLYFDDNQQQRCVKWQNERLDWNGHVEKLLHCNQFESKYHRPLESFNTLVRLLQDDIKVDFVECMNSIILVAKQIRA